MHRWWVGGVVGIGLGVLNAGSALAQTPANPAAAESNADAPASDANAPPAPAQENFGFGPTLGFFNPSGLDVRAGSRDLALDVSAGFVPLLLSYGPSRDPQYKLLLPLEVSPQLVIHVLTFRDDVRGGLRLGYRYNSALGHAATLGGQISKRISRKVLLEGMWGVSYYPRASSRLRGDQVPAGTSFAFPPELGWGLSVSLLFFP